jgi:glycosyltransferase involved in cell wall biosynthesis
MKPKHIAFITHSPYPIEPRAKRMAEALAHRGYTVDVFCLRWPGEADFDRVKGVTIYRLPVSRRQGGGRLAYMAEYFRSWLLMAWHVTKHHLRQRYALVQVYNPPDVLAFSTLLPRLFSGTRVVLDVRDMAPELFMSRFGLSLDHPITRALRVQERWACRYADAVTVCTQHQFNVMAARGIKPAKMAIVMNTPDEAIFGTPVPLPRSQASAAPDRPLRLIYHGSILTRYGLDVLVEAVPHLLADVPNLQVDIYGFGDFKPAVQALAVRLGVAGVVRFRERLPLEEMPAAIAAADIGVVPVRRDVFTDTILPTKLMEYAHMGVPAVVGRTSTTSEYFDDDMVAYFEPEDPADLARQVLMLHSDPNRARALADNARHFTVRHNWPRDEAAYAGLIAGLIGDNA